MIQNDAIISNVVTTMSDSLSSDQLKLLEATLIVNFHGLKVEKECTDIVPVVRDWEFFLKRFRATKRLKNCSEATLEQYEFAIAKFREYVPKNPLDVTDNDIKYFLSMYGERKVSKSYLETLRRNISAFYVWMHAEGYVSRNPVLTVPHIKVPKIIKHAYTGAEMEQLRFATADLRDRALLYFLDSVGCRISEALSVNLADIDWQARTIVIYGQKSKAEREVYFTEECAYHLQRYVNSRTDGNPALFVSKRAPHQRLKKEAVEKVFRDLGRSLGIHAHPHKSRRTMITRCNRRGMSLQEIQAIAGHAKPETTQVYIDMARSMTRASYEKVS